MKKTSLIILLLSLLLVISACSSGSSNQDDNVSDELPVFTVAQLAEYDGKDGRKAYVAIDGIVYDVSNVSAWNQGGHQGLQAGQVLSDDIKNSPHGTSVLSRLPKVGKME